MWLGTGLWVLSLIAWLLAAQCVVVSSGGAVAGAAGRALPGASPGAGVPSVGRGSHLPLPAWSGAVAAGGGRPRPAAPDERLLSAGGRAPQSGRADHPQLAAVIRSQRLPATAALPPRAARPPAAPAAGQAHTARTGRVETGTGPGAGLGAGSPPLGHPPTADTPRRQL